MNYKNNETKGQVYDFSSLEKKYNKTRERNITSKDYILMNVVFKLVNENQAGRLTRIAHRKINDMVMIYVCEYPNRFHQLTVLELEKAKVTETEIYNAAIHNTAKLYPAVVRDLKGFIEDKLNAHEKEIITNDLIVVTNATLTNGAGAIMYRNVLSDVAKVYESDLYIIPTSVHEVLIASSNDYSLSGLYAVFMCEREKLAPHEFLSRNIYRYSRESKELSPVTHD